MTLGLEKLDVYRLSIGYNTEPYEHQKFDPVPDSDFDPDEIKAQQIVLGGAGKPRS